MAIVYNVKACLGKADCLATECCAGSPGGRSVCMGYFKEGDRCSFHDRAPVFPNEY
jgi:hypothetical protein